MWRNTKPPQAGGLTAATTDAANMTAPERYPLCAECERPVDNILDLFFWDNQPMHQLCMKAKARRCMNQIVEKLGMR